MVARQCGSHLRLVHPDGRKVTVARHNRPIFIGTLQAILNQAKINSAELLRHLK